MDNRIEFIDQKDEQKEIRKGFLRELLDGSLLARSAVIRQLPFILFITFIAVLYISNRYHAEKVLRQTVRMQNELRELRAESISTAAELMHVSKQSEVAKLIEERKMELKASLVPPKQLKIKD